MRSAGGRVMDDGSSGVSLALHILCGEGFWRAFLTFHLEVNSLGKRIS